MTGEEYVRILREGVQVWNTWRESRPYIKPDFSGSDLRKLKFIGANLRGARFHMVNLKKVNLSNANLRGAFLSESNLVRANLTGADLRGARLYSAKLHLAKLSKADLRGAYLKDADLSGACLREANLRQANLSGANLEHTDFRDADLRKACLTRAILVETDFEDANLADCTAYGLSAWGLKLKGAKQTGIRITPPGKPAVTVDNLEVAQLIYLILNNNAIRDVIDTITSKMVLILGRFTYERMVVLNAILKEVRQRNYVPVLFNFEKPSSRDITETVMTLAQMSRFVIADITEARSIPQELMAIVPHLPSVPIQPILIASEKEYGMFEHFKRYPWVLETYFYTSVEELITSIERKVINPAEAKANALRKQ